MNNKVTLADRVKELRTAKNMGIRELGRAVDVTGMHMHKGVRKQGAFSKKRVSKAPQVLSKASQLRVSIQCHT